LWKGELAAEAVVKESLTTAPDGNACRTKDGVRRRVQTMKPKPGKLTMSKPGRRLIAAARERRAIARGEAGPAKATIRKFRTVQTEGAEVYVLSRRERRALDEARRSPVASDEEVAALWKRLGIG
jgi:hypothetical protein